MTAVEIWNLEFRVGLSGNIFAFRCAVKTSLASVFPPFIRSEKILFGILIAVFPAVVLVADPLLASANPETKLILLG